MTNIVLLSALVGFLGAALILASWPLIYRRPKTGEVWRYKQNKNRDPWDDTRFHDVEVLDVRAGWVRYRFVGSSLWQDERQKMKLFVYCFEPTASPQPAPPPQSPARP